MLKLPLEFRPGAVFKKEVLEELYKINIKEFKLETDKKVDVTLTYQVFGEPLYQAPIVLVNHALTGNSNVTGENGWWKDLIGDKKAINTQKFTVLAFNIPGNGFEDSENLIEDYKEYTTKDIASIFWKGLEELKVEKLFAVIGGSLGGGIAWEMIYLKPKNIDNVIPIATNWKSSDWLTANVLVQDAILNNSNNPIHDARLHAMLLYRTPESLQEKFNGEKNEENDLYKVESWLKHHGDKLSQRFELSSYKLMNHLLKTIGENRNEKYLLNTINNTTARIHLVSVNTDYFFTANEIKNVYTKLKQHNTIEVQYYEIQSKHGHDAFLIEYEQLNKFLAPIFNY